MANFPTITQQELESVGVVGLPDTPSMTARAMQEKFEETARSLLAPKFNALAAQLEGPGGAAVGAAVPEGLPGGTPATVQGVLNGLNEAHQAHTARQDNPHAVTAQQTGAYTRQETEQAIDRRVLEIGAGDMARAEYDPNGRRQDVYAYADDVGVHCYTHQKVGTVHRLTGSGACGRVKLTANVAAGDTLQVNGKTVPAYAGGEPFADAFAGEALSGRWLSFVWDGAQVNFKGGGGLSATKLALADAVPADVRRGKTFYAGSRGLQTGTAEYPQYLGVVSATIGANAVLADYTLTPGVWRIVAAAWRDNREYGYIAVQVGGTEHGGIEPTYGHGRVLDVTLNLTENTGCRVLTRSAGPLCGSPDPFAQPGGQRRGRTWQGKPPHPGQRADIQWKGADYGKKTGKPGTV